jgi:hypothetical protein
MQFIEQFNKFIYNLAAPLYFHLGGYNWFLDVATIFSEVVDTNVLYFLYFFFLNLLVFYKNTFLKNLFKSSFKLVSASPISLPFIFYYNFFLSNFKKLFSYFSKVFDHFFRKK